MKYYLYIFILYILFFASSAHAESEWTIYASYHNPTKAVKAGDRIFALANGDLFSYNAEDTSVETYDKTNALSDFGIYDIAYSSATKQLVILYQNGNIDIMNADGEVVNMPDLKTGSLSDKTLNNLCVVGKEAFISASSALVVVDLQKYYFENTFKFPVAITSSVASSKFIYAKTSNGAYVGDRSLNLLNMNNWVFKTKAELDADSKYKEMKNENVADAAALATVKNNVPDSPIYNYAYKLNMIGNRLLVAGGNFYYPHNDYTGCAMKFEGGKWTAFDDTEPLAKFGSLAYRNVADVVQDPNDSEHHFLGTVRSGIYEFRDYKYVKNYSFSNSPLQSILPDNARADCYVRVTGLAYDKGGNLWMCNNETDTVVTILKADGKWVRYYYNETKAKPTWDNTYFDSRGLAWINCRRTTNEHGPSGLLIINTNGTIDTQSDDTYRFLTTFNNQDGTSYSPDLWYCVVEDLDGTIWMGNTHGVFTTTIADNPFESSLRLTQIKVPRNDGSNLADYLLSNVPVKCIRVDGANRKWIGTVNNGVYLLSADGIETIYHFTKENSPLIDNEINDIAINGETGEVFIATPSGLCSFNGDATDAEKTLASTSLKVYPNPVRPEYSGDVHITGLAFNTDVKIANAAGKLVYSGVSNGGRFDWNCCYKTGKRVASGIYYVLCTDEEGNKGACAKILIVN